MNHTSLGLELSKAITGFLQHKTAAALSPNTLKGYEHYLQTWLAHVGDIDIGTITTADLRELFVWLRTEPIMRNWANSSLTANRLRSGSTPLNRGG